MVDSAKVLKPPGSSIGLGIEGLSPLLQVFDMRRSLAFYRDLLGFAVIASAPPGDDCDWCLLRLGASELMLNTRFERSERPPAADPASNRAHGDTTLFFGCPDLDAAFTFLRDHGVDVAPPVVRDYGMRQLAFCDPDGYGVCLQWRAEPGPD